MYFSKQILIKGHCYKVLGTTRDWNPMPGTDLKKYPLPSKQVTELSCPEAGGIVTSGETEEKASNRMIKAIMAWLDREQGQADGEA